MSKLNRACAYLALLAMFQNICIQTLYALPPVVEQDAIPLVAMGTMSSEDSLTSSSGDYNLLIDAEEASLSSSHYGEVNDQATHIRWAKIDAAPTSLVLYPVLGEWVGRHGKLLSEKLHRVMAVEGFRQGFEFMLHRMIHVGLLGLTSLQFSKAGDINDIFDIFQGGDKYAIQSLAYKVNQNEGYKTAAIWAATLPLWWGFLKAGLASWTVYKNPKDEMPAITKALVHDSQHGLLADGARWLIPLHPVDRHLNALSRVLRWDGRLNEEDRGSGFSQLLTFHHEHGGYSRIVSAFHLAQIAHMQAGDQMGGKGNPLKEPAVEAILQVASGQGAGEYGKSLGHRIYGRYLLWWLGLSDSKIESATFWSYKAGKMAVNAFFLKTVIEAIEAYLNCPQKKGQSFTGPEPWASSYSVGCFDELVRQFNRFPGQPANTLVDAIPNYHFKTGEYFLDLGGKGIEARVLGDILKGFTDYGESKSGPILLGLDISGNDIGASSHKDAIYFGIQLSRLINLEYLNLARNSIEKREYPSYIASEIGKSLPNFLRMTKLNLSHNFFGNFFTNINNGTSIIGKGIGTLKKLKFLDLSNNYLGESSSPVGAASIGGALFGTINLEQLDLSHNSIGSYYHTMEDTLRIAYGLGSLKKLKTLDLSHNKIGKHEERNATGTKSIFFQLKNLKELSYLNLNSNNIRPWYNNLPSSTEVMLDSISTLTRLETLMISYASIGYLNSRNSVNTRAFGENISKLKSLKILDLSHCSIGAEDESTTIGTKSIALGVEKLELLEDLNLSGNNIGLHDSIDSSGTKSLGKALSKLSNIRILDLSENNIGCTVSVDSPGVKALGYALSKLSKLEKLAMLQSTSQDGLARNIVMNKDVAVFFNNQLHQHGGPYLRMMYSEDDVRVFFKSVNKKTKIIDLSSYLFSIDQNALILLFKELSLLSELTQLNLSSNKLGWHNDIFIGVGQGIGNLTQLESLDLSHNFIGSFDYTNTKPTECIGEGIGNLNNLKSLDLSHNSIGGTAFKTNVGTKAIAKGVGNLPSLVSLNLSHNKLVRGVANLFQEMSKFKSIKHLDISYNNLVRSDLIGLSKLNNIVSLNAAGNGLGECPSIIVECSSNSFFEFAHNIGLLKKLVYVDFSDSQIGLIVGEKPDNFFLVLQNLNFLKTLKISRNYLGRIGSSNISEAIGRMTELTYLDLSENYIGQSEIYIGKLAAGRGIDRSFSRAILRLKKLEYLNVSGNPIGLEDKVASSILVQSLVNPNLKIFDISDLQNANWTDGAKAISRFSSKALKGKCEAEICYGKPLNHTQGSVVESSTAGRASGFSGQQLSSSAWQDDYEQVNSLSLFNSSAASSYFGGSSSTSYMTQTLPQVALVIFFGAVIYKIFSRMAKRLAPDYARV